MATWSQFAAAAPALAAAIRGALHQYGPGLGYLATIRPDGGPRLHPVSPAVIGDALYCCLLDSPKRRDLERDGRYALHAFPSDESDDEACLRGRARLVTEPAVIRRVADELRATRDVDWWLYELRVETAISITRAPAPSYRVWHQPRPPRPVALSMAVALGGGCRLP